MRISWSDIAALRDGTPDRTPVRLEGYPVSPGAGRTATHFLLTAEPGCCAGCAPRDPAASVEVFASAPLPMQAGVLHLTGIWRHAPPGAAATCQLHEARAAEPPGWRGITRRGVLAGGPLICLAAPVNAATDPRLDLAAHPTIDLHSHAGGIANVRRIQVGSGFSRVAEPMRAGGMAAICLAVVSDGPTHHVTADHRIRPYRDPAPGELYEYGQLAFRRVADLLAQQGMGTIRSAADLRAAQAGTPAAVIAAEGADFLEGRVERVDEAHARWGLRHLQLTHYRVNELGDIQTEAPVHDGLTDTGAAVIRRCNQIGVVVDVAHGTLDLVKRAAAVTTRPLVLSHTSLTTRPRPFTRLITPEHARIVAGTSGVIGIWPPASLFPDMPALAAGMARMVDAVGIDHVGLGTDMRGLVGASVFPDYDRLPDLAAALRDAGFKPDEVGKLLGGNYARVFTACVG